MRSSRPLSREATERVAAALLALLRGQIEGWQFRAVLVAAEEERA